MTLVPFRNDFLSGSAVPMRIAADPVQADIFSKALSAQLEARSYRVRMETVRDGKRNTRLLEHVFPHRFRVVSDADEIIIVDHSTFRRVAGASWQRVPFDLGFLIAQFLNPNVIERLTQETTITFNRRETLDGQLMLVFQSDYSQSFGNEVSSMSKMWISETRRLLCRLEMEIKVNGVQSSTVNTYYDYNAEIIIEPPI